MHSHKGSSDSLSAPVAVPLVIVMVMSLLLLLSVVTLVRGQAAPLPEAGEDGPVRGLLPPVPPYSVKFQGPRTLTAGDTAAYTATVYPVDASVPITYTWQVDDYADWVTNLPERVSARDLTWARPGTKYIRVIVENEGGTDSGWTWVDVLPRREPDLTVTDMWYEGATMYYQLLNQGDAEAPGGHTTHLNVDGSVMTHTVSSAIPAGRRLTLSFDPAPRCTDVSDRVRVTADQGNLVDESDELNNVRYETWFCDRVPPVITVRPSASGITQDQATITWETDEPTSSAVYYDDEPAQLGEVETDFTDKTHHSITLTGLTPGQVYEFKARSQDGGKNTVDSAVYRFETSPPTSEPPAPVISMAPAADAPGYYRITALFTDTTNIDRVEFSLNGAAMGTDYGTRSPSTHQLSTFPKPGPEKLYQVVFSPKDKGYTWKTYHAVQQEIGVLVVYGHKTAKPITDFFTPDEPIETEVQILHPDQDHIVGTDHLGHMDATVYAAQYHWGCTPSATWDGPGLICDDVASQVAELKVYLDGQLLETVDPADHNNYQYDLEIPVSPSDPSPRTLRVEAVDDDGAVHSDELDYSVVDTSPQVSVSRNVTKHDTHFDVTLTIANDASSIYAASIDYVVDNFGGFQAAGQETDLFDVITEYDPQTTKGRIKVDFKGTQGCIHINPGTEVEVTYQLVPILYESGAERQIGEEDVLVSFLGAWVETAFDPGHLLMSNWSADAIGAADYIIVTNPERLFTHAGGGGVDVLLTEMAHLAVLRNGVLGYLSTPDYPGILESLVADHGEWTQQLHPDFRQALKGYMLIVGEAEIVPAWRSDDLNVDLSDQPYSNRLMSFFGTGPVTDSPSLIVGRAVGNDAAALLHPIQTSIRVAEGTSGYGFNRSEALVYSGVTEDRFVEQVDGLAPLVDSLYGTTNVFHEREHVISYTIDLNVSAHDRVAAGHLFNTPADYIVYARIDDDSVSVMDQQGNLVVGGQFTVPGLQDGDQMAVGDVDGDGLDDIIFGLGETENIMVLNPYGDVVQDFYAGVDPFEGLAVGDVDGDGVEEIIHASVGDTNNIRIYDGDGWLENLFSLEFGAYYGLASGKTASGEPARIMVARPGTSSENKGETTFYTLTGGALVEVSNFEGTFLAGGSILADNVLSGADEELLVVSDKGPDDKYDWVFVLADGGWEATGALPVFVDAFLGLAAGDMDGDGLDEIILANPNSDRIEVLVTKFSLRTFEEIAPTLPGTDLVIYRGHGSPTSMGALRVSTGPFDFGSSNPLVWGPTCLSGLYQPVPDGSGSEYGMTEALLESKAAAHIGATETSSSGPNIDAVTYFVEHWDASKDIGSTFLETEWNINLTHDNQRWIWEYNLYGDPKYGVTASAAQRTEPASGPHLLAEAQQAPADTLQVSVPDFEVSTTWDGYDEVTLPGGAKKDVPGGYRTLIWPVQVSYPAGTQVADVALTARAGEVLTSGLNITRTSFLTDSLPSAVPSAVAEDDPTAYTPELEQQFDWFVLKYPDGTSELMIHIYPFYYSPATTNVKFYQEYTFDITSISNSVDIDYLATDNQEYPQGQSVLVELGVHNSGAAQDVTVAAEVQDAHGNPLDGLLLRNLHELEGDATFDFAWDTTGAPTGDYRIAVTLSNDDEQVLDALVTPVRLGIRQMAVQVAATPTDLKPGQDVEILLSYSNAGTVPISGTLIIEVGHTEGMTVVHQLQQPFTGLAPGDGDTTATTWQTTEDAKGTYTVLGYAAYDSRATSAPLVQVQVGAERKVFLPTVMRR